MNIKPYVIITQMAFSSRIAFLFKRQKNESKESTLPTNIDSSTGLNNSPAFPLAQPISLRAANRFIRELRTNKAYLLIPLIAVVLLASGIVLSPSLSPLGLLGKKEIISPLAASFSSRQEVAGAATESALPEIPVVKIPEITETMTPMPTIAAATDTPSPTPTSPPALLASYSANVGRISFPNNKFGVYTYAGGDYLDSAAELVNSNGGDWGWVTIPIPITERNSDNWNGLFNKAKEKHLIPILQISNTNNQVPSFSDIDGMAGFLAGLGWPAKIRVVSLFNEVNAGEYWGGKVDPEGYAQVLSHAIDKFHSLSPEFFVMNGAFNSSAHTLCTHTDLGIDTCYLSLDEYLRRMNNAVPGIFGRLDGWANHSYPHPAYRGSPYDSTSDQGRLTIRAYRYDLRLLSQYGVSLPVFITETGWPHSEGKATHSEWLDQNTVANYYKIAFTELWLKDPAVVAVTPFQLKRDDFDNFAFVAADGSKFPQWNSIVDIPKVKGTPSTN